MELKNFGSILNFAAELEAADEAFYRRAAQNSACVPYKDIFEELVREHKQNEEKILRIRRENVTEMILEPIKDFMSHPFLMESGDVERMDFQAVLQTARKLEIRSEHYYSEAAEKIKALPEVSRELRKIGKKHEMHRVKFLDNFSR